ncbi:MAG: metallopeptidase family protein [Limisphaerales bacterium]
MTGKCENSETDFSSAKQIIHALIARLPNELRPEVLKTGYELLASSTERQDNLGDYSRTDQSIRIFVQTLRQHCREKLLCFSQKVGKTYLHELGHHLGLSEDDLSKRGLE